MFKIVRGDRFVALSSDTHKLDKGLRDRFVDWAKFLNLSVIVKSYNVQGHK